MKYDLVIFDCDGTLVDSEPVTMRLIVTMMKERGLTLSFEDALQEFAGKNLMLINDYMEQHIGPFDHDAFEEEYRYRCLDVFDKELEIVEGVDVLIHKLKIPYCIASNGPRRKMDVTLKVTGLDKLFPIENIYSAYDIKKWKPEPDLYLYAAKHMNVEKSRAIVVEDTLPGLMGAVNGGIDVVAYNPHENQEMKIDGVPNFKHMNEIGDYFATFGIV